jgi:hypothetical protein
LDYSLWTGFVRTCVWCVFWLKVVCVLKIASYFVEISEKSGNLSNWVWPGDNMLGAKIQGSWIAWYGLWCAPMKGIWNTDLYLIISSEIYNFMRMFDLAHQNLVILDVKGVGGSMPCSKTYLGLGGWW